MKDISYKIKYLNRVVFLIQRKPLRPASIQNMSCVYKKNLKYDKNWFSLLFLSKTGVEASRDITKFKKKILVHQYFFTPSFDTHTSIFDL